MTLLCRRSRSRKAGTFNRPPSALATPLLAPTPQLHQHSWLYWGGQLAAPIVEEPLFRGVVMIILLGRGAPIWLPHPRA